MKKENKGIFDIIAPIYGLFYHHQIKQFNKILLLAENEIDVSKYQSIIDIGCGTGALCAVLNNKGLDVTGVDASHKMLNVAKKQNINEDIIFNHHNIMQKFPFNDNHFDLSIASHVAHGLTPIKRKKMYKEMARISKHYVIIHDYNQKRTLLASFIEWLEGGDYFNFIKVVQEELEEYFDNVQTINVSKKAAWYICSKN